MSANASSNDCGEGQTMNLSDQFVYFLDNDKFRETDRAGFRRRVVTGENLQLCFWRIAGGATGSFIHHHADNEQLGIIARGRLNFRIGESEDVEGRIELGEGEVYLARPGIWHGDSVFIGDDEYDECWILDVFAPPRDDLRGEG
jgi:mannose-6-phosphate isomerase-like protein (cupin superfamily)